MSNHHPPDTPVSDILDRLRDCGQRQDRVSIKAAVGALRYRSYGPFLLLPALLGISPLGAIPGVPTALALITLLFAVQIVLGRDHIWMPDFVQDRTLRGDRLEGAVAKLRPVGRWLDRYFHVRMRNLTTDPFIRTAAAICVVLALPMPFLELVPFGAVFPLIAIAAFGLAMTLHDGLLMIAAGVLSITAIIGMGLLI